MKTVPLKTVAGFLDHALDIRSVEDDSRNGLQVEAPGPVSCAAFAVDCSMEGIRQAARSGAQLLVVHHGLIWGGLRSVTGPVYRRVKALVENGVALYGVHLPLDRHPRLGNNARLCALLKLTNVKPFAWYHGQTIGFCGTLPAALPAAALAKRVETLLGTQTRLLDFGPVTVRRVGVVSGAGADALEEACLLGLDLLLTGEPRHASFHAAAEGGIHVLYAGHYATETLGVRALMPLLSRRFGIQTVFLDIPTGI